MALERKYVVTNDLESAYNTPAAAPTNIPAFIGKYIDKKTTIEEAPIYQGTLARTKFITTTQWSEAELDFFLKGSGAAGTAPENGKLLKACGLSETIVAATSVKYAPRDSSFDSIMLKLNNDGLEQLIGGARGSLSLVLKGGQPIKATSKMMGLYNRPTVVSLPVPSYADVAVNPPICTTMGVTIAGNTYKIAEMDFNLAMDVQKRESLNAATFGIDEFYIAGRSLSGSMKILRDSTNQILAHTNLETMVESALACSAGAGSAGNIIKISANNLQFEDVKNTTINGEVYYDIPFRINYNATLASEFQISFT